MSLWVKRQIKLWAILLSKYDKIINRDYRKEEMVEITDFDHLFKCVVDDVYKDMLRYKEQRKEELEDAVIYTFLSSYWQDNAHDFDDYIMDICENNESTWSILIHYETSPIKLLYDYRDAQNILEQFKSAVAKEATDRIIEELKK